MGKLNYDNPYEEVERLQQELADLRLLMGEMKKAHEADDDCGSTQDKIRKSNTYWLACREVMQAIKEVE